MSETCAKCGAAHSEHLWLASHPFEAAPIGGGEGAGVLTRSERIREDQKKGTGGVTAVMVSRELCEHGYTTDDCYGCDAVHEKARADALAVEVERLMRERDDANTRRATDMEKRAVTAETANERLRAAIEAAPHGTALKPCAVDHYDPETYMDDPEPCDCWKSKALEGSVR